MSLIPVSMVLDGWVPGPRPWSRREGVSSVPLLFMGANTVPTAVVRLMSGTTMRSTRESNLMRRSSRHTPSPNAKLVRLYNSTGYALKVSLHRLDDLISPPSRKISWSLDTCTELAISHYAWGGEIDREDLIRRIAEVD